MLFNFTFYSFICIIFLVLFIKKDNEIAKAALVIYVLISVFWLWAVLVFRKPVGDPWRYIQGFNVIADLSFSELLGYDKVPLGFALLNWLAAAISTDAVFFFSIVYVFCVVPLYLAFRERFDKVDSAVLIMLYLLYPFYLSSLGNIFKQGIGFGFMLWGLACLLDRDNPKIAKGLILLFSATLFHSAFWIPILTVIAWYCFFRKRSLAWAFWSLGFCVIMAVTGVGETIITAVIPQGIIDSLGFGGYFDSAFYLSEDIIRLNYVSGFRLDFAIFTLAPLVGIFYITKQTRMDVEGEELVKIYCLLAGFYFLLCFIPFSDRLATFSWFLVPYLFYFFVSQGTVAYLRNYLVIISMVSYALLMLDYNEEYFQWLPF